MTNSISPDSASPNPSGESGVVGGSGRTQPAAPALGRTVTPWKGKTNDAPIPNRVRMRVFERDKGRCQCGCGHVIRAGEPWQTDHIIALINGGEHSELNLQTLWGPCHKLKTKSDVAEKSQSYKAKLKTYGLHKPKKPMPGGRKSREKRTVDGRVIDRITGEQIWPRQ